jgi:DNA invertase Pin-like site-specific DNA recombinase
MNAIGYVRVSTEEQAREGISLENQKAKIQAYCKLHDFELDDIIEDAGKSGKDLNREGVKAIIQRIKERGIDAVIVYKLDRLSRRVLDTLNLIELMKKHKVIFHSITDSIDTKTAMGKFFLNIMASLAQMERDLISERTKDALRHKISRNERAGQIPYGWTLADDGKTLVVNIEEQKTIRFIRELHRKGLNYSAICRELTRQGYQPLGSYWYAQSVKNILKRVA